MAERREISGDLLMQFMTDTKKAMEKLDENVAKIADSVSILTKDHVVLKTEFDHHLHNEEKVADIKESKEKTVRVCIAIISILVTIILFGLGNILKNENGREQEKIERVQSSPK